MKTGLEKMVEWLDRDIEDRVTSGGDLINPEDILRKARSLLAEEQAQAKPPCKVDSSFLCDELIAEQSQGGEMKTWIIEMHDEWTPDAKSCPIKCCPEMQDCNPFDGCFYKNAKQAVAIRRIGGKGECGDGLYFKDERGNKIKWSKLFAVEDNV